MKRGKILQLRGEGILKIVFLFVGLGIVILSIQLGIGSLAKTGPGLLPFLCGILIFFLTLMLFISKDKLAKDDSSFAKKHRVDKFLSLAGIFILWIILMPVFGYIVLTFLTSFSFAKVMGLQGWRKPFFLCCGITIFCYILFDLYLYIDLPRGFLE